MLACNIMTIDPVCVHAATTLQEAREALSVAPLVPVVDNSRRLIGVLRPASVIKAAFDRVPGEDLFGRMDALFEAKAEDLMEEVSGCVMPETPASEVAELLSEEGVVFVVDDGKRLLGVITPAELFNRLWEYSEKER